MAIAPSERVVIAPPSGLPDALQRVVIAPYSGRRRGRKGGDCTAPYGMDVPVFWKAISVGRAIGGGDEMSFSPVRTCSNRASG